MPTPGCGPRKEASLDSSFFPVLAIACGFIFGVVRWVLLPGLRAEGLTTTWKAVAAGHPIVLEHDTNGVRLVADGKVVERRDGVDDGSIEFDWPVRNSSGDLEHTVTVRVHRFRTKAYSAGVRGQILLDRKFVGGDSRIDGDLPSLMQPFLRHSLTSGVTVVLTLGLLLVFLRLFGTSLSITTYPMLLARYRVASVDIVEDTAPFPPPPMFTSLAASDLADRFISDNVVFGQEGMALAGLCRVAHPTANCMLGDLVTPLDTLFIAAVSGDETIAVDYRLRFTGGFTGSAYTALVRVTFRKLL